MEGKKRRILMVNLPYSGHTNPSLGLVRCLIAAGHEVDYVQAEGFRARVARVLCPMTYRRTPVFRR